ncbi:hypothetical protein SpCBS45565_g04331 [Spizellomyces sp. 'palustris']|nr:hypothetical protein SpCBS45565_g04331 [Spizellomyces sp. 'palustris']
MSTHAPGVRRPTKRNGDRSAPTTPRGAFAARKPRTSSQKKEWDSTTHDLSALKLSPLQLRLRKANAEKYTHEHRAFAKAAQAETGEVTESEDDTENPIITTLHNNENKPFPFVSTAPPAISISSIRPPSPTRRRGWGHHGEVDFEGELKVWEKTNRVLRKPNRTIDVQETANVPEKIRAPLREVNETDSRGHDLDMARGSHSRKSIRAVQPSFTIPVDELRQTAEGIVHWTNTISSQLDEPTIPISVDTLADLENQDAEAGARTCLKLVRDLSSRSTKLMSKLAKTHEVQNNQYDALKKRMDEMEVWVVSLQTENAQAKSQIDALHQQLKDTKEFHGREMSILNERLQTLLISEETRAIDNAVKQALAGSAALLAQKGE